MSFGYGVGDCLAVAQLAWKVYKSCRDAPESFGNIQVEVLSLHAVLKEVEEALPGQQLTASRQQGLSIISQGCEGVLKDLEILIQKYESLGSKSKRTWDRMKWSSSDVTELRARLTSNTVLLTAFMSTSQLTVERQLNKLIQEFQEGRHEGSVLTVATVESISMDDKQTWRAIRKELEDIGISIAAFDANKEFIMSWFHHALETGAFEEQDPRSSESGQLETHEEIPTSILPRSMEIEDVDQDNRNQAPMPLATVPGVDIQRNAIPDYQSPKMSRLASPNRSIPPPPTQARKSPSNRRRPPKVASFAAWVLRYDKSFYFQCSIGNTVEAQLLLEKGANINCILNYDTPLSYAVRTWKTQVVYFLLTAGADIEHLNGWGHTPLHEAIARGSEARLNSETEARLGMMELLLQHGAEVEGYDGSLRTPLCRASEAGDIKVATRLLRYGAKVQPQNGCSTTPLQSAVKGGHHRMVELLLDSGAIADTVASPVDPKLLASMSPDALADLTRDYYLTPLVYAVARKDFVCCKTLIKGGAKLKETYEKEENRGFPTAPSRCWYLLHDELQKEAGGMWPSIFQ